MSQKSSCDVTISFSSRGLFTGDQHSALEVNGISVNLLAHVDNQPNPNTEGSPLLQVTMDQGYQSLGSSPTRTITIKNIGNGIATSIVASLGSNISIETNRCPSVLKPQASCQMKVYYQNFRGKFISNRLLAQLEKEASK